MKKRAPKTKRKLRKNPVDRAVYSKLEDISIKLNVAKFNSELLVEEFDKYSFIPESNLLRIKDNMEELEEILKIMNQLFSDIRKDMKPKLQIL